LLFTVQRYDLFPQKRKLLRFFSYLCTKMSDMKQREIYSCAQMMELIQEVGFLPLLDSGIRGYSADGFGQADYETSEMTTRG